MCYLCQKSPCVVSGTGIQFDPDDATTTTTTSSTPSFVLSTEPTAVPTRAEWQALDSGYAWTGSAVTFGFASGATDYYGSPVYSGYSEPAQFIGLSAAGKNILRAAFSAWGGTTSLTITEAASGVHPDMNVGGSAVPDTAWAYYPGTTDSAGDIWFGLDQAFFSKLVSSAGPYIGSYEYATALHEIGHALGLKHPHQGTVKLAAAYDGLEYSVMSYRSYLGGPTSYYTVETWSFPQSLMMLDIAQIQDIYGADFTTQSGNTVYSFDPLTGEMTMGGVSAGVPGANRVFRTIWDGGGTDTIDLAAYTTNLAIDLNPGKGIDLDVGGTAQRAQLSSTVYAAHHIYMSLLHNGDTRSLIENATGGSGADILTGNQTSNALKGGGGNDTLTGGLGADTLTLGSGNDTVSDTVAGLDGDTLTDFNLSADQILVQGVALTSAQVWYVVASGQLKIDSTGDGTADAVINVNLGSTLPQITLATVSGNTQVTFTAGSGTGTGSGGTVLLTAGNDSYVNAATSNQSVDGLGGNDSITTGSGNDTLVGGAGVELMKGMSGNDSLYGDSGADTLYGGDGDDSQFGGAEADKVYGEAGNDVLWGDDGTDYLYGGANDDVLHGGDGTDELYGEAGNDLLEGDAGTDLLYGGAGSDELNGGASNDKLYGDADNDILNTGSGAKEFMTGGAGSDVFVFEAADFTSGVKSQEYVNDFVIGEDSLGFYGFSASSLNALQPRDTTSGLRLTVGTSNFIYLKGLTVAELSAISATFSSGPAPAASPADAGLAADLSFDPLDDEDESGLDGSTWLSISGDLSDAHSWVFF